jgi:hypothetical protein
MIYYHKIIPVSFARQDSPEFKKSNFINEGRRQKAGGRRVFL